MIWTIKWNPWPAAHSSPTLPLYLTFFIIELPCMFISERFTVTGSAELLQAKEGEDIMLPCHLSPKMDARKMVVKWFRNKTLVHRYHHEDKPEETQGPEFQGRTELLKQDMAEGKVILRIHQVQVSDAGPYSCHFLSPNYYNNAHFELQVAENLPTSWKRHHKRTISVFFMVFTGILVTCFFCKRQPQRIRAKIRSRRRIEKLQGPICLSREAPAYPQAASCRILI